MITHVAIMAAMKERCVPAELRARERVERCRESVGVLIRGIRGTDSVHSVSV